MNKKTLFLLFSLVLLFLVSTAVSAFAGGDGSSGAPYQISNCTQLQNMSSDLDAYYELVSDIDCSDTINWNNNGSTYLGFEPVGNTSDYFTGVFNGANYTISDLFINRSSEDYVGLFGYTEGATLANFSLLHLTSIGNNYVGGVTGIASFSTSGSDFSGIVINLSSVVGFSQYVGGLTGILPYSSVSAVVLTDVNVSGDRKVGGLTGGAINSWQISNSSFSKGVVFSSGDFAGGLVGYALQGGFINNSFVFNSSIESSGDSAGGLVGEASQVHGDFILNSFVSNSSVFGSSQVGGLVGFIITPPAQVIIDSTFFNGSVVGSGNYVAGLLGRSVYAQISNSFSKGFVYGLSLVGGLVGGLESNSLIINSYSLVNATGSSYIGGLVGHMMDSTVAIYSSFSAGKVTQEGTSLNGAGGLVGGSATLSQNIFNSYWDVDTSTQLSSGGSGAVGLTTQELQSIMSFFSWNISYSGGVDLNDGYPFLAWQNNQSETVWLIDDEMPFEGAGTELDPYVITNCEELQDMDYILNAHYVLNNSIDCINTSVDGHALNNDGLGFKPIGLAASQPPPQQLLSDDSSLGIQASSSQFLGILDGRGYTISNLFINSSQPKIGLFSDVAIGSEITNLHIQNANVTGTGFVGILAGNSDGLISGCSSSGFVSGTNEVGGLVGNIPGSLKLPIDPIGIRSSFSSATVNIIEANGLLRSPSAGGLVGKVGPNAQIHNSYFTGMLNCLTSHSNGGLVGYLDSRVENSFSSGLINCTTAESGLVLANPPGGLVGSLGLSGSVFNSFWDYETSGRLSSAGGLAKTTSQMKDIQTFVDAGWNINYSYGSDLNDGYPFLAWQENNSDSTWVKYEFITDVSFSPELSDFDVIDPNSSILVNLTISTVAADFDSAVLEWKNSTQEWSSLPLAQQIVNSSYEEDGDLRYLIFNMSLPEYEDLLDVRIYANNTLGLGGYSDIYEVESFWDCSWSLDPENAGEYIGLDDDDNLDPIFNLTIFNTGDEEYIEEGETCDLSFYLEEIGEGDVTNRIKLNDKFAGSSDYGISSMPPGDNESVVVSADFLSVLYEEDVVLQVTETTGLSETSKPDVYETVNSSFTLVSAGNNPYLVQKIDSPPSSLDLVVGSVSFDSYLRNLLGASYPAYNVSVEWIFPQGFANVSNASFFFENISDSDPVDISTVFNLSEEVLSSGDIAPGNVSISLISSGVNESGDLIVYGDNTTLLNDTVNIELSCSSIPDNVCVESCGYPADPDCSPATVSEDVSSSGGSGSGVGSSGGSVGASVEQLDALFQTNATYVLVRGDNASFSLEVENPFNYSLTNISVNLSGFLSQYLSVESPDVDRVLPNHSLVYDVFLSAPDYVDESAYDLLFTIDGFVDMSTYNDSYTVSRFVDMTEEREVKLYVVEISLEDALGYFNESLFMLDEMRSLNFSVDAYQTFLRLNQSYFDNYEYSLFKDFFDLVKSDYDALLGTIDIYDTLEERLNWSTYSGLETPETKRLFSLSEAALDRGDYSLAFARAKDARLTFALETVGAFNAVRFVVNNWWQVLVSLAAFLLLVYFVVLLIRRAYYSFRIRSAVDEKRVLFGLMKQVQRECFSDGKLSMEEYTQNMLGYEDRLNKVVSNLILFTNKKHNLFRFWISPSRRLLSEKDELLGLIRDSQKQYLRSNTLETRVYNNRMKTYSSRLGEIEEQLAFVEAKKKLRKF